MLPQIANCHRADGPLFVASWWSWMQAAAAYIEEHNLQKVVEDAINATIKAKPSEPFAFMVCHRFCRPPPPPPPLLADRVPAVLLCPIWRCPFTPAHLAALLITPASRRRLKC
jgi:hypothetical protein